MELIRNAYLFFFMGLVLIILKFSIQFNTIQFFFHHLQAIINLQMEKFDLQ